jgi:SAM-dependent methyltransferase
VRRALTHVGGPAILSGAPEPAALLARALDVEGSLEAEAATRAHVHGFHSYPARMHPVTARRLVEAFSRPGDRVLDPFCGSGTALVEARLAGRAALGVDANPLAVRLARLKVRGTTEDERGRLVAAAREVAAVADQRRKARAGASRRYAPEDAALFDPHVLLELDGLRVGLDRGFGEPPSVDWLGEDAPRGDLELVLSAILTKVSRRSSDTTAQDLPRRIAAGYPARLFVRKAEELARRLAEAAPALALAPPAVVEEGDARALRGIPSGSIDLVITSPPYPGVYDYLAHHEARLRWLRLPRSRFDEAEIGARRRLDALGAAEGRARWQADLTAVLIALARVLRPGAPAVLLLGDGVIAGAPVHALDGVRAAAPAAGLEVRATASQERPHFHAPTARAFARRPRREHAILLERRGSAPPERRKFRTPRGPVAGSGRSSGP